MLVTSLGHSIVVRFARKPIWMPTAPSKLFRMSVLTREFYDNDEIERIKKLYAVYEAQMETVRQLMKKEFYEPATRAGGIPPEFLRIEEEEDRRIYEENDRKNAEIAKQKEDFFKKYLRELEDKIMEEKLSREEAIIDASEKVNEYIRTNKDNPDACITPENFEKILEKHMEQGGTSYEKTL